MTQEAREATELERAWVLPLARAAALDAELLGAKAGNLARLQAAGLPVPAGFVVTAAAWRAFAAAAGLDALPPAPPRAELPSLGGRARAACLEAELPAELAAALAEALETLAPAGAPLAVRSAALDEDGVQASGAGLFHTALDVPAGPAVGEALRACWASRFDPGVLAYLHDRGERPLGDLERRGMAVVVQRMVQPRAAGVLFSAHEGGRTRLLVEAVAGPCAALVDGRANPVRYRLPEDLAGAGDEGLLPRAVLRELMDLTARVEAQLHPGVDVEWAWDPAGAGLQLLQARPVTRAVPADVGGRVVWTAANTQEALVDPVTPLTWTLLSPLVEAGRRDLFRAGGFADIPGPGYMKLFYGRVYFNPEYFREFLRQIPGVPENIFDDLIFAERERGIEFVLPHFSLRTLRLVGVFILLRLAARERFELFQRRFGVRLRRLSAKRLSELSDPELLDLRARATRLLEGALRQHVLGTTIAGGAYLLLEMFLRLTRMQERFPAGLASRLASGAAGNALALASGRLEDLARRVARGGRERLDPDLPRDALYEAFAARDPGFPRAFRAYLREFGHRCVKEAELFEPRWGDDPSVLLEVLRSYVQAAEAGGGALVDLREREARLAREAGELAERVSAALAAGSRLERVAPAKRGLFRYLLREARRYAPYRENLKDRALRALHLLRQIFLELGTRLVQRGRLDAPDDVFFLELSEAEAALRGEPTELRERITARRAERRAQAELAPPRSVVELPGRPPHPVHGEGGAGQILEGVGVSSGRIVGTARVLSGMEEAGRLRPGEILVARVINGGWVPLFHLAAAVVAEVGGVLSHGGIVAREYGIPAVFGAAGASAIPDGARIAVDGDLGIVSVEAPPEPA